MMSKRPIQKYFLRTLLLSLVIILAGGGVALLYQWQQGTTAVSASSDSVVGQPSLPAATVDAIFQRLGSPMVGTGQAVESAARAQNMDDAFALAVWWTETNDGAAGVGLVDRNPGSVRGSIGYPSAYDGYTIYPSYTAAVNYWFIMLKQVYIERGLTTVYAIAYPYVGTSTSDLWAGKVFALMQRYRAEAPPPTPTPTPTPVPTIAPDIARQGTQLTQEQQQSQGQGKSTYYPPVVQNTTAIQGLSGNSKLLLVLFDLLLALVLAVWAWSVSRRYAGRVRVTTQTQPANALWEEIRANSLHGQQTASFSDRFSVATDSLMPLWPTTEALKPILRTTETLEATTAPLPICSPAQESFVFDAFPVEQKQFRRVPAPQTPAPQTVPVFLGREPLFNIPITEYIPAAPQSTPGLLRQAGALRRTRLQPHPAGDNAGQQPQPVGVGVSSGGGRADGLLSRYREMRDRSE